LALLLRVSAALDLRGCKRLGLLASPVTFSRERDGSTSGWEVWSRALPLPTATRPVLPPNALTRNGG